MTASLDMVGIVVKDIKQSLRFYRALGVEIAEPKEGDDHVEAVSGGIRLAWDTVDLIKGMLGEWEEPRGNRMDLAFKCGSPEEVNDLYQQVLAEGFTGFREPWDAFWGQRYAILEDPDGNHVDLFA